MSTARRPLPDFLARPGADAGPRVLVLGDLMLDRYWHGATQRISPEAPVPVVHVGGIEERPGGAGNVALNAVALGAPVTLVGPVGDDEAGDRLQGLLEEAGVACCFHREAHAPTITKLRILSRHQQLIRLDFEDGFPGMPADALDAAFEAALEAADVVVLSDYAKGALPHPRALIRRARAAGKPVLVDPKGRDYARYEGATLITPNLTEFRAVVGEPEDEDDLGARAAALAARLGVDAVLVTRGEHGMTLAEATGRAAHLKARAREVFDVTGAGDTVIATLAVALGAGAGRADAAAWANAAAGVVVGKLGTATVTPAELRAALEGPGHEAAASRDGADGVLDEAALGDAVAAARARGERIVMTNGCFDLLHSGHIDYLERARALGDRLVVAVNDDASVGRLKGDGRPVVDLEGRLRVLAALGCVDWVVPFAEDTPARLIEAVAPDVLVKGGDYRPEEIAGHDAVTAAGGEVKVLDFVPGRSTSDLVARIRGSGGD